MSDYFRHVTATAGLAVALLAGAPNASADVFGFKDLEGFEACLDVDHVVESVPAPGGWQTRYLDHLEVQLRCISRAVGLLGPLKAPATDLAFIRVVRQKSTPENAIDLVSVLAGHGLAGCNEMAAYDTITTTLSYRAETSARSLFARGRAVARRCLADKTFRADFMDERTRDGELGINACELLRQEKLVPTCPRRP